MNDNIDVMDSNVDERVESTLESSDELMAVLFKNKEVDPSLIGKPVIEFKNVVKIYDHKKVLDNLTLTVNKGDIYGFVGENGAGKSTAMRVLAGLISINDGEFIINGVSSNDPKISEARKNVGAIIESPALFLGFNAYDNLKMNLILSGQEPNKNRIEAILKGVGLADQINSKKKAGNFSLGMRQRLGIAMAFVNDVDILILDEPINGLDPKGIIEIRNLILDLHKHGATIFISSHILSELSLIATRYGFISHGKVIKELSSEELMEVTKKKTVIKTNDNTKALSILESLNITASINGDSIEITSDFEVSKAITELAKESVIVNDMKTVNGSIEDFYMEIINGGKANE